MYKVKAKIAFYTISMVCIIVYLLAALERTTFSNSLLFFAIGSLFLFWVIFYVKGRFTRFHSFFLRILFLYLSVELFVYILLIFSVIRTDIGFLFGAFTGTNKPIVNFDRYIGYRCVPGERRYLSIIDGEVEIDHITRANKQGWYSRRDFSFHKPVGKKRYMVLGDSYSAGLAVSETWVDLVQQKIEATGEDSIELYNFSQEGAGLVNWWRIFTYEIIPHYEYDGVIFAVSSEKNGVPNLDRDFIVAGTKEEKNCMAICSIPNDSIPNSFDEISSIPVGVIALDSELENVKMRYTNASSNINKLKILQPRFYLISMLNDYSVGIPQLYRMVNRMRDYQENYAPYEEQVAEKYNEKKFYWRYKRIGLLISMLNQLVENGKEIIWITIPDYEHALSYVGGEDIIYRKEAEYMTSYYGLQWLDGYMLFHGKDTTFVENSYYPKDKHWNQKTVLLFSDFVTQTLFKQEVE